jgi:imidazolonepropionase-like amidohydrolase
MMATDEFRNHRSSRYSTNLALGALLGCMLLLTQFPSAHAETIAVTGAKIYTMTGADALENATLIVSDGRVQQVRIELPPPAGAHVIDGRGKIITPGLMSAGTQLGLLEVDSLDDTTDQSVTSGPLGAAFDIEYALNPNSTSLVQARADGLTRAVSFPSASAGAPFSGTGAVLRLSEGVDIVDRRKAAMFASVGGMASAQNGGSRSAQWILLRNALDEAKQYRPARKPGGPRDQLLNRLDIEALQPLVERRMALALATDRESDIRQAVRLAEDYALHLVIYGGAEAWRCADLLAERKIPVVLDPFSNLPWTFDQIGARADNAAILQRAGVIISFAVPGLHMSHDAGAVIREAAGIAVANGLPWLEGLKALTINPASIFGIADHYGTLAGGQEADFVIWDGDPLEPTSAPQLVYVRGKEVSLHTRQKALAERYSPARRSDAWPPVYK